MNTCGIRISADMKPIPAFSLAHQILSSHANCYLQVLFLGQRQWRIAANQGFLSSSAIGQYMSVCFPVSFTSKLKYFLKLKLIRRAAL